MESGGLSSTYAPSSYSCAAASSTIIVVLGESGVEHRMDDVWSQLILWTVVVHGSYTIEECIPYSSSGLEDDRVEQYISWG